MRSAELRVALLGIARHAEHDDALLAELRVSVAKRLGLLRAARCSVLWIEVNDPRLVGELAEVNPLSARVSGGEVGGSRARRQETGGRSESRWRYRRDGRRRVTARAPGGTR